MGFLDAVVMILFVLFMIFIFGGYHKNKSAQREMNSKKFSESSKDSEVDRLEESNLDDKAECKKD